MTSREQLKQCQSSWSAFTTRQERAAKAKWLRWAAETCRTQSETYSGYDGTAHRIGAMDCARAIEAEIPPPTTKPVVREGLRPTSSVSHGKQYAKKPPQG